jgi:putative transposase
LAKASLTELRGCVEEDEERLSIERQCALLGLSRSSYYYQAQAESEYNLVLMRLMDEEILQHPFYGSRRLHQWLLDMGHGVNIKRVRRLLGIMGHQAIYPKPLTSTGNAAHQKYPYLLRNVPITYANQVWSSDITFVPMPGGYAYLVAVMDWYSRLVLSWELSNTMSVEFCTRALERALAQYGQPGIFNTDQGSQFTSHEFTGILAAKDIRISMDGRGRALDNVFNERLWRSVKYERLYLYHYSTLEQARLGLEEYFTFYNHRRPHQGLPSNNPPYSNKPYWVYHMSMDAQQESKKDTIISDATTPCRSGIFT